MQSANLALIIKQLEIMTKYDESVRKMAKYQSHNAQRTYKSAHMIGGEDKMAPDFQTWVPKMDHVHESCRLLYYLLVKGGMYEPLFIFVC